MKWNGRKLNEVMAERVSRHQVQEGHAKPLTRRDFLAAGLIQGAASFAIPSLATLLPREARAADLIEAPPAFIEINLAGGAGILGNVAMLDGARNLLPSYNLCGQGARSVAERNIVNAFGNRVPMFKNAGLYRGLSQILSGNMDVLEKSALINLASSIGADTGTNPMSAFGLVQGAIASGRYLPNLQTFSNFNLPAYVSPPSPIIVQGVDSILDVVRPRGGDVIAQFQSQTQLSLLKHLKRINDSQITRYASRTGGGDLKSAAQSAMSKVTELIKDPNLNFDPRKDPAFVPIWKAGWEGEVASELSLVESGPEVANRSLSESTVVYALAKGYANTGGLYRTGYDYHGNARQITDAQDAEVGKLIGRVLLSFKAAGRPVFIYLTSDGTVFAPASDQGGNDWVGDSSVNTVNLLIAYHPTRGVTVMSRNGKPETQVGSFTNGQISDQTHPVASPRGSAAAAYLNYLKFAGVDPIASGRAAVTTLDSGQLRNLLAIEG